MRFYPRKYAFLVSQKSDTPTCGSTSFCKTSLAYLILLSLVTPGLAPLEPMKLRATFCSWITKASSKDGFTCGQKQRMLLLVLSWIKWNGSSEIKTLLNKKLLNFSQKGAYHFHHLRIIKVIDDVFQDVSIGHKSQSTEYDDDGYFLPDIRQSGNNPLADGTFLYSLDAEDILA